MHRLLVVMLGLGAFFVLAEQDTGTVVARASKAETYRLVHALGNDERIIHTGMSQNACRRERDERRRVTVLVGVGGSLTCLPESLFAD